MTLWFCDRCGKQVTRDSNGAGKYDIQKSCIETNPYNNVDYPRQFKRSMKFCDQCAIEIEKFLDDEFSGIPSAVTGEINRRS